MEQKKKRGSFIRKFKSQNKPLSVIFIIIGLLYLVSLVFFTKSILSLSGIETLIRIVILVILYIYLFIYGLIGLVLLFTRKKKSFIALIIIAGLLAPIMSFISFHISKTYGIIDSAQKKYVTYTSYMVSMNNTTEYNKIGMISAKDDPTGYIIPKEMIKEFNIGGEIVEYDDYISMMSELYDGEIDALFVADSYVTMFNSYEKFENIQNETKMVYELSKKLENKDNVSYSTKDLTEPFTILLMGVDATGDGIASSASFNGDTLMLISFNPKTLSATIFSIPRDTYVPISCRNGEENKINSSAYGGTSCVVNTVQDLTGIDIDYYVKINFTGVVKLVDDLGGVYVDVPVDFCEQDSERRFGEYLICLEKGYQKLSGEQALALARHRKTLPLGDFQRVQHQQLVVEAIGASVKNIRDVDSFYKILDDIANNVDTNMSTPQILSLYKVAKNVLTNKLGSDAKLSIQKTYLTGYDLTMYLPKTRGYAYTFQYYRKSLSDIVEAMRVNLELTIPKPIKTFSFSANEVYEPTVAGKTYYQEARRELLPNFVGQNKTYSDAWANERGITVNYKEVTDSNLPNGYISAQGEHQGVLVESLKSINLTVVVNSANNTSPNANINTINESININEQKEGMKEEKTEDEVLPNFVGMSLSEFNKWKASLKNQNLIIKDPVELTPDKLLTLNIDSLRDNTIYDQSSPQGTKLSSISTLTVYYYKAQE